MLESVKHRFHTFPRNSSRFGTKDTTCHISFL